MKTSIVVLIAATLFLSGCSALGAGAQTSSTQSESKLSAFQGIGVLSFIPIQEQLLPGGQSYVELTIRNNALGQVAKNIVITLDHIHPFSLLDCTGSEIPLESISVSNQDYLVSYQDEQVACDKVYGRCDPLDSDCGFFLYDNDSRVALNQHGLLELFTGDEYDFIWGVKAPEVGAIKGIYYKQDLYYIVEYDYGVNGFYNLIAMSNTEAQRRRDVGESLNVPIDEQNSAGPIDVVFEDEQVFFDVLGSQIVQNFIFTIENKGTGVLSEGTDARVVSRIPDELDVQSSCANWWDGHLVQNEDGTYRTEEGCANKDILYRDITSQDFFGSLEFFVPFKINEQTLTLLRDNNIPLTTFTFFVDMNYTYSIEGSTTLQVRPLGGEQ
ncbi:hypothetical protein COT72_05125 [archaeon CG10_big_fil_rev_8_21_14_0_10_43_11]|nr:MAG: hypothetical protein COT72_05125 [archaeon CG10_big_fil_rev_8_21_14_0_10_43_11]